MKKAIVDVCDTLYFSNTTFDFLENIASGKFEYQLLALRKVRSLMLLNSFLFKLFKIDVYRRLCIYKIFSGKNVAKIKLESELFYDNVLCGKEIIETHEIIKKMSGDYQFILCSASISPVVEVIAAKMGCEQFFSTCLITKNEVYTGQIVVDLLGKKNNYLRKANISYDLVITDNKSDVDLIKHCKKAIIISREKNISFWNEFKLNNETINIKVVIV
ncbi:haloacid dehalogenase-like hydrolase [Citrobacter freundii]|mgnify:CR=1|uniref:haloacid dehalogenase-like hydrolase n=1 Tax=Citrobacter TaxID=544 RepID=UPI0005CD7696|nr:MULTISPECIES: haloacid dehalogenase-like hydrolase [Citrobacter]EIX7372138.1 haloacid dehalogenase-like hydrolase [Citrobacter freundii]EJM7587485.1 haloacid dehalogenase-like hydrolase [Citrobacter freundii]EKU2551337.1 haloacid dehalogenase-like hydrolase [Citrobacter freundii]EKW0741060.1 haloacid dehalogenase-like hydrolase [Citrobacter freundii]ELP5233180.1 haloacid dehalogenase-like hydrolase [Citrobacter freundii]